MISNFDKVECGATNPILPTSAFCCHHYYTDACKLYFNMVTVEGIKTVEETREVVVEVYLVVENSRHNVPLCTVCF